jgi:hypothetical protein
MLQTLILDQDIHLRARRLVLLDDQHPHGPVLAEHALQVLLIGYFGVVADRRIDHRDQMVPNLILRVVGHHVPPLQVVCEEHLEVGVLGVVQPHVDVVVVRAGV